MARAAEYYLRDVDYYVFIICGLVSIVSAVNATILAGSRVKLAMARRDHLPATVKRIQPQSGVPSTAVMMTEGLILVLFLLFAVIFGTDPSNARQPEGLVLGLESLAHLLISSL